MKGRKAALLLFILIFLAIIFNITTVRIVKASPISVFVDPPTIFDTSLAPGTQFSVDICVDYVEKLWGYQFWLSFNPEVLKGVSVEDGAFLGSMGGEVSVAQGAGFDNEIGELKLFGATIFFMVEVPEHLLPSGGGVLATLTFEVVSYGGSSIKLGAPETALINKTGGYELRNEAGEWEYCYGQRRSTVPPFYRMEPYLPWIESLGHGEFDNRPGIYVDPSEIRGVHPTKNFTINVDVANMTDLYSWEFSMEWNATLLNAIPAAVTEGDFLEGQPGGTSFGPTTINNEAGTLTVRCETLGSYPGVTGSGTLVTITFSVLEIGACNLTIHGVSLIDSLGNPIAIYRIGNGFFDNHPFHDIAVISVIPYPTAVKAGSGEPVFINVTVANIGDYNETVSTVTVYYENNEIGSETDVYLEMESQKTLAFIWNTSGVEAGKYMISALASPLPEEVKTTDNTRRGGEVIIGLRNIAIINVKAPVSNVFLGHNVTITVVVKNKGTELETFNVTTYYDGQEIGTLTVVALGYNETRNLKFIWDTTGVEIGKYFISANATTVEDEEDTADNFYARINAINVLPLEEQELIPMFVALPIIGIVIVGAILFFWRRRRPPETFEMIRLYSNT